jgi:multisubunit Na+/H+ antiporter MnhB subunit
MKKKTIWTRVIYIIGIIALIIGAIDPLEGSVVIASGSALVALSTYLTHDRHWKIFLISLIMILIGVFFLFYLSSLGGFGGTATLSWWWGTLILPYPFGWLMSIIILIVRAVKKPKQQVNL